MIKPPKLVLPEVTGNPLYKAYTVNLWDENDRIHSPIESRTFLTLLGLKSKVRLSYEGLASSEASKPLTIHLLNTQ